MLLIPCFYRDLGRRASPIIEQADEISGLGSRICVHTSRDLVPFKHPLWQKENTVFDLYAQKLDQALSKAYEIVGQAGGMTNDEPLE